MNTINQSIFKGRDFISLHDFSQDELSCILDVAKELKDAQKAGRPHTALQGKTLGMIFTSLRHGPGCPLK